MSDDPKRWRDTDDRELAGFVAALSTLTPSDAMKDRVWSKIAPTLPPGPGSGGSGAGGAGSGIGTMKLAGFAGLAIASGVAVWVLTREPAAPPVAMPPAPSIQAPVEVAPLPPPPSASEAPEVSPPASAASAASVALEPKHAPSAKPAPTASAVTPSASGALAPSTTPTLSPADRLREEAEGVRRAQRLLREKNASGALAELDRLQKQIPNGALDEEREVLAIEALAMSGKTDLARRRAARFLEERPQSVHAARVRSFANP